MRYPTLTAQSLLWQEGRVGSFSTLSTFMAILKIAQMGNPILRRVADPIDPEAITGHEVQHLIGEMYETMLDADGGLAAPQVHCSVRLHLHLEDGVAVLINPVLTPLTQDLVRSWEGLSVRGMRVRVDRVAKLNLEYYDQAGKRQNRVLEGWNAIVAQHECDHLDGILYIDRCDTKRFVLTENRALSNPSRGRIRPFSLFKSNPEAQIQKAKKLIDSGEYARARNLIEGLPGEDAKHSAARTGWPE